MSENDLYSFFGVVGLIIIIPIIVLAILYVVGLWKVLEKGGKPGWASLVPFYGQYLLCEMTGVSPWWIAIVIIASLIPAVGQKLSSIAGIYFNVILSISVARAFKKEDSYGLGLFFLAPIFYLMLGTGKDAYAGPNPVKDIIFDNIAGTKDNSSATNNGPRQEARFCTSCGNKVGPGVKFCPKCGKEVKKC